MRERPIYKLYYFQLTSPSCLLEAGILRLNSVTSILKNFEFDSQLYVNPTKIEDFPNAKGTFQDAFSEDKVLASNPNFGHAAALFDERFGNYIFKDSTIGLMDPNTVDFKIIKFR